MKFIASETFRPSEQAPLALWDRLKSHPGSPEGVCYYKHPIIRTPSQRVPHFTFLARGFQPICIDVFDRSLEEIGGVGPELWNVSGQDVPSPFLALEDYLVALQHKFKNERMTRHVYAPKAALALPFISEHEFLSRGSALDLPEGVIVLYQDSGVDKLFVPVRSDISDELWKMSLSVFQGVNPLNRTPGIPRAGQSRKGDAIRELEKQIAILDDQQHEVAVQIAPGPQRIRGLAGTGKTVVLAMKAANIHLRYPESKILFTFHTQSLYNQVRSLITRFYRVHSSEDPDWDVVHVLHGWGSRQRPGVYSEICQRRGAIPLDLQDARQRDRQHPFRVCCEHALSQNLTPFYDYVLVDEAQDFPDEFFRVLFGLATDEKRICWAYDELQSLAELSIPTPEKQFGVDPNGTPLVVLDGEYPGSIEKDIVLRRSYRCPRPVLMVAHGIGLGIHHPKGCLQMLDSRISWNALGYEAVGGDFTPNSNMILRRPDENSPSVLEDVYTGGEALVTWKVFDTREDELRFVADEIVRNVHDEAVRPEDIIVISLDAKKGREFLAAVQRHLHQNQVASTIPGLMDSSWKFAEERCVTLTNVYRAKGNEAPVVFVIGFDALYDYVEELENRNRAFTAISRTKGWVRMSGVGNNMAAAAAELDRLMKDIPEFRFLFPDMLTVRRRLDASESTKRRQELGRAKETAARLFELDPEALQQLDPKVLEQLRELLKGPE